MKIFQAYQPTSCINVFTFSFLPPAFFLQAFLILSSPPPPQINPELSTVYLTPLLYTEHPAPTWLIHNGQCRYPSLYKYIQGFNDRSVGMDEGNVVVSSYSKFIQILLHKGRLWHLWHLGQAEFMYLQYSFGASTKFSTSTMFPYDWYIH